MDGAESEKWLERGIGLLVFFLKARRPQVAFVGKRQSPASVEKGPLPGGGRAGAGRTWGLALAEVRGLVLRG